MARGENFYLGLLSCEACSQRSERMYRHLRWSIYGIRLLSDEALRVELVPGRAWGWLPRCCRRANSVIANI